ncbi:hypothetical protein CBOM_07835 [Ceraceosorus bombacis]|uniref:Uncharacterized protein n=1 Tax=Ceraceosorus bombacis TaxID=401625 RepID=A0A0P1BMP9_9BASI|nr:hypothetical protein CBOM_07835 [Ceraceosorus bombacis]
MCTDLDGLPAYTLVQPCHLFQGRHQDVTLLRALGLPLDIIEYIILHTMVGFVPLQTSATTLKETTESFAEPAAMRIAIATGAVQVVLVCSTHHLSGQV